MRAVTIIAGIMAAAAATAAPVAGPSHLGALAFGVGSYESYALQRGELERAYKIGFALGGHFQHGAGRLTHVLGFRYRAGTDFDDVNRQGDYALDYACSICLAEGRLCPAVRPFFDAHYATGPGARRSQGEVGVLGGARYKIVPGECTFSDVYGGWRGRYGSPDNLTKNRAGWKSSLIFRNDNTIHIAGPACLFVSFQLDFDLTDVVDEVRKPTLAVGAGPAFTW